MTTGRRAAAFLLYAVLAVPAAIFVAFLLTPFWRAVEAQYGVESLGHSGPATWCFALVYGVMLGVNVLIFWRRWRAGG
ncbi:MAG TPA: hypothetical protein VG940_07020 [Gemmatimonadales bacterium]|nr:hypothetical protein [Gemmatimonadales bacterium]